MRRLLLTFMLSAVLALNIFSQLYSKIVLDGYINSRILSTSIINDHQMFATVGGFSSPEISFEESLVLKCELDATKCYLHKLEQQWFSVTGLNFKSYQNSYFIGSQDIIGLDSQFHWYYTKLNNNFDTMVSRKYQLPIPFTNEVKLYGIELVKNDEVILWGNGFDPKVQNKNDSIKFVWIRIKTDGTLLSGPHFWKPKDTQKWGIATDALVNSEGNLVFIRESRFGIGLSHYRGIYEIKENDEVTEILRHNNKRPLRYDYAKFCETQDRCFISYAGEKDEMPVILKLKFNGDTSWACKIEQKYSDYSGWTNVPNIGSNSIQRIRECNNGDIIFCGTNNFIDTIYNYIYKRDMLMSDLGGAFFGRISPNGELKWIHYMISVKNATDCHYITPFDINELSNGDLLLAGSIGSSPDTLNFNYRAWLMRVNEKGCFDNDCSHVNKWWYFPEQLPVPTEESGLLNIDIQVFPNPFKDNITLLLPENITYPLYFQISNLSGQLLMIGTLNDSFYTTLKTNDFPIGNYILSIRDAKNQIFHRKIIQQ